MIQEAEQNTELINRELEPVLKRVVETLVANCKYRNHILEIWLFGSHARGTATPKSDIDLLVVLDPQYFQQEVDAKKEKGWMSVRDNNTTFEADVAQTEGYKLESVLFEEATLSWEIYRRINISGEPPAGARFLREGVKRITELRPGMSIVSWEHLPNSPRRSLYEIATSDGLQLYRKQPLENNEKVELSE